MTLPRTLRGQPAHWLFIVIGFFVLSCQAIPVAPAAPAEIASTYPARYSETVDCPIFPDDNIWNTRIDHLPVHPLSDNYISTIGADEPFHADFGSGIWPPETGGPIGIPFALVDSTTPKVEVEFDYATESDPGPYPIPPNVAIEGGPDSDGDRHVLLIDTDACVLYELYYAFPLANGNWEAGSGAIFDLNSNQLRPADWTSADAAGLPIFPGLVRYEEVTAGEIAHALRFTAPETRRAYVWPARHFASDLTDPSYPPMGQRFRLRSDYDVSSFAPEVQVILRAMQDYGIILADNGSPWYVSGSPDERWDNDVLRQLSQLQGRDLEAVDTSSLMIDSDSGQALHLDQSLFLPAVASPASPTEHNN